VSAAFAPLTSPEPNALRSEARSVASVSDVDVPLVPSVLSAPLVLTVGETAAGTMELFVESVIFAA
jgi:hypothetical protein